MVWQRGVDTGVRAHALATVGIHAASLQPTRRHGGRPCTRMPFVCGESTQLACVSYPSTACPQDLAEVCGVSPTPT